MKTALVAFACLSAAVAQPRWVATWSTSSAPQLAAESDMRSAKMIFQNQTFRQIVHTSIGGDTARVRISNVFGSGFLQVDAAHMALRAQGSAIVADSDQAL